MPLRRAIGMTALAAALLAATGVLRAQIAPTPPLSPSLAAAATPPANASGDDEPLRRLDPATLAGGDYGTVAEPNGALAGGEYGRDPNAPATAATRPDPTAAPASAIDVADPLARRLPLRAGQFRPRRTPDADDPYAPVGVRAGSFILRPTIETAGGYDTNPDRLPTGKKGSSFIRLRGDLDATSDWSRHELQVRLSGQGRRYLDLSSPGYEPEGSAIVDGRVDVTERTQVVSQLRASITTSRPGDPETPNDIKGDEIQRSFGATLGVAQRFNRFSLQLDGLVDRYLFDDSKLLSGETLDNSDRIYSAYQLRLRGAYELSPALQPFAEIALDTRDYDKRRANAQTVSDGEVVIGDRRLLGSSGYALRGGARFEATRLITGEIGLGYGRQTPKENSLKPVDGLLVDGSLAWAVTPLTTVRLNARSAIDETTTIGSGGILNRSVGVAVEHALRRNWTVTARADYQRAQYQGAGRVDDTVLLGLETEYRLNRTLALFGSFEHERLNSSLAGEDYDASIIEFGLRVRR